MIKTPAFWYAAKPSVMARLLSPFSKLYALGHRLNTRRREKNRYTPKIDVVCVGNITAGGAGKTPLVLAIYEMLEAIGKAPLIISRGYGGTLNDSVRVDPDTHNVADVGDEPLMMAAKGRRVFIGRNRVQLVKAVEERGDCLVMDDGFQDPSVKKTLSVLVFDGEKGLGNGLFLPAGPLREPPEDAMRRADMAVIIGDDGYGLAEKIKQMNPACIIQFARIIPDLKSVERDNCFAFAGIGLPEKFFAMLRSNGIKLKESYAFADHHAYRAEEIEMMLKNHPKAQALTTEKDFMRVPDMLKPRLSVVPITLEFADQSAVKNFMRERLL